LVKSRKEIEQMASGPHDYQHAHVFVDGPVIHHFDHYGWGAWRPGRTWLKEYATDICKSMSPVDTCRYSTEGGGAENTPGYLSLTVENADEFYAESAPTWWIPGRYYDLRDTWAAFHLKEIEPIRVAPGYEPHLFIAAYMPKGLPRTRLSCWYLYEPLKVGKGEWVYQEVHLTTDERKWGNYYTANPTEDTLAEVLSHCGFIGWMYMKDKAFTGVQATGTMGWDEVRYNLKAADLEDLHAGRPLKNALEF
jgi:hypothetical protein